MRQVSKDVPEFSALFLTMTTRVVVSVMGLLLLSGCFQSNGRGKSASSRSAVSTRSVNVLTFQDAPRELWKKDPLDRAHTNSRTLRIAGTCASGVIKVQVVNGTENLGEPVSCDGGTFTFEHSFDEDAPYVLKFLPVQRNGSIREAEGTEERFVVDTIPPAAPVIVTNQGRNFYSPISDVHLIGQVSSDTTAIESQHPNAIQFSQSSREFGYDLSLVPGQTARVAFRAVDLAGNISDPATIEVSYDSDVALLTPIFSSIDARGGILASTASSDLQATSLDSATSSFMIQSSTTLQSHDSSGVLSTGIIQVSSDVFSNEVLNE